MNTSLLKGLTKAVGPKLGAVGLALKKVSPEILLGAGVVGFVATNVLTARSTTKLETKLELFQREVNFVRDRAEVKGEDIKNKDMLLVYAKNTWGLVKLYSPSIIVGTLSIAALISSNKILRDRNVALMAAYQTVASAYYKYREKVRAEFGEEVDFDLANFTKEKKKESYKDEEGKKKTKTVEEYTPVVKGASPYARFFDELSPQWQNQAIYNLTYLRAQESYFNDRLMAKGHVFLNEVYDSLGIPRTKAGQVVGWRISKEGDNMIDFGIYDLNDPAKRMFVNGYEKSILLDFNVDGVIYDKIEE